ncbi:MAG: amidohydrolase, partial [Clostridia bacterium]|nr:amidohydrolase [Clostridia bacterium]
EYGVYEQGAMFSREDFDPMKTISYFCKMYEIELTEEIKKEIEADKVTIDCYREWITALGETVLQHPELGYFEEETSKLVRKTFDELEIAYQYPYAVTGVKATLSSGKKGPNVCIIGEMDALICKGHPYATQTGVAHACGHHAQVAAMLGAAIGIKKSGVMEELGGTVTFMAVPAEEYIDLSSRIQLKNEGKIRYFGGKQQLFYEGAFDDVDIVMMIHAQTEAPLSTFDTRVTNLGFMAKSITFYGKAAHGSRPAEGVNALNAAALAILGVHSNRDTFTEDDKIRIHPIITKGGDVVNSVPDEVCIETYVRGATFDAIKKGNAAVNRAVQGASQMIGTTVRVEDFIGFLPLTESLELNQVSEANAKEILGEDCLVFNGESVGSSDIGDVSAVLPTIQPCIGGFGGVIHSKDFLVSDPDVSYVGAAKILAGTCVDLLLDDCKKANEVIEKFKPVMTRTEYQAYLDRENFD